MELEFDCTSVEFDDSTIMQVDLLVVIQFNNCYGIFLFTKIKETGFNHLQPIVALFLFHRHERQCLHRGHYF